MDSKTLKEKMAQHEILVIDIRDESETRYGMIPGAKWIRMNILLATMKELPKDKKIVLYCQTGEKSEYTEELLKNNGYDVDHLEGGMYKYY